MCAITICVVHLSEIIQAQREQAINKEVGLEKGPVCNYICNQEVYENRHGKVNCLISLKNNDGKSIFTAKSSKTYKRPPI